MNIALVFGTVGLTPPPAASHLPKRTTTMTDLEQYDEDSEEHGEQAQLANDLSTFCEAAVAGGNSGSVGETNLTWLALDLIEEQEGFNLRDYSREDTVQHIERLAAAWARSEQFQPLEVKIVNGHCYVRDGHCRLRAAKLAAERGAPIKRLPVIELKGSDQLATVRILTSNEQLKITIIQRARGYQRLREFGFSDGQIAMFVGRTDTSVRESIRLLLLPESVQELLEKGIIKPFLALDLWRKYGSASEKIILDAYEARQKEQALLLATTPPSAQPTTESPTTPNGPDKAGNESDQASPPQVGTPPEPAAPVPPPIRLTSRNIKAPTKRIGKKLITNMTTTMTGISRHMRESAVINTQSGSVSVQIPIEEYERFISISNEVSTHRDDGGAPDVREDKSQMNMSLAS